MIERKDIKAKSRILSQTYTYNNDLSASASIPVFQAIDKGWAVAGTHGPTGKRVYVVRKDVAVWIEEQAPHMWKHYDPDNYSILKLYTLPYYLLSEELLAWMELRWG